MDHYDDDQGEGGGGSGGFVPNLFGTGKGVGGAYYLSNEDDPYITLPDEEDEDEREEMEDLTIHPRDLLLLGARNEDDVSFVEVWLCAEEEVEVEEEEGEDAEKGMKRSEGKKRRMKDWNLYVHHDIMLPAFPLSLAWMNFGPQAAAAAGASASSSSGVASGSMGGGGGGNFVAVATMDPGIEIWDLDVLDAVEPAAVLGGMEVMGRARRRDDEGEEMEQGGQRKAKGGGKGVGVSVGKKKERARGAVGLRGKAGKGKKSSERGAAAADVRLKAGSHAGAVLSVAWNSEVRSALASGGEDASVRVWDLTSQQCVAALLKGSVHVRNVQAVTWRPRESGQLLSGSFDATCALVRERARE